MEVIIYTLVILIALVAIFFIIEYPMYLVGLLIFMMFYRFNLSTPLPLDARGLLTILLFVRMYVFDKANAKLVNHNLLTNKIFWIIILFFAISLIIPIAESEKIFKNLKDIILNIVALILGFLTLLDNKGKHIFLYAILAVSFFSTVDLIYTNIIGGGLNVVRVLEILSGQGANPVNHNFPGMLSTFGIFFIYLRLTREEGLKFINITLGLFYIIGVLLSTSRSALLALILVIILMHMFEEDLRKNIKKFVFLGVGTVIGLVIFFLTYNIMFTSSSNNAFLDKVYYRLIEEPLAMVGLTEAKEFDIYSQKLKRGSMNFRADKWKEDFGKFSNLEFKTISLGLGVKKYSEISEKRWGASDHSKGSYAAHNGYLIILVERGVIGLVLFLMIIFLLFSNSYKVIKQYVIRTPVIYLFLFLAFYSFAQNSELLDVYAFLMVGGVLGNIYSCSITEEVV